jgi:hypothetical protein
MIKPAGYKIEALPYKDLTKVQDILYVDGPLLAHFKDDKDKDYLAYWVDYDEQTNRVLIFEASKRDIYNYLSGGISLRRLICQLDTSFVFLVDQDSNEINNDVLMLNAFSLPDEYLPDERSFYTLGLPVFYDHYLRSYSYIDLLRARSYIFKLEPTDNIHDHTVSTKEAGSFLISITKSIDSYIDYTATSKLKDIIIDRARLNKTINQIKQKASPRVADSCYDSFNVSLAIDNIVLKSEYKEIEEWQNGLIESYKNDVLDVDYSSQEDAIAIVERFPDAESRKKIFDPIFKILENRDVSLSVSSYNKSFERSYKKSRPGEKFKTQILPKQTIEDLLEAQEQKTRLVTAVFKLPEGGAISDFRKKELIENLLFTQEGNQPVMPIPSPIVGDGQSINLIQPLECLLMIDSRGYIQLFNSKLDLQADANNILDAIDLINEQFIGILNKHKANPEYVDEKTQELDRLTGTL